MGQYTSAVKVRQLYPQLNELTSITDGQVDFYISQAEAELDGRLSSRYTLPFSYTPALVEALATEYALIKLMDRFYSAEAPTKYDWKEVRRRELKELMGKLSEGVVLLVNSAHAVLTQRSDIGGIASNTTGYIPTFNHLDASQQVIDTDRLDDEEDALK